MDSPGAYMVGFEGMVTPFGKKILRSAAPEHLVIPGFFMYTNVEQRNRIHRSERRPYKPVSIGRNGDLKPVSIAENNC